MIQMSVSDAKLLLNDVLEKRVCDSTLVEYIEMDKSKSSIISLQSDKIKLTEEKLTNTGLMVWNLESVVKNKDTEIDLHLATIKEQVKEIRKQKRLKVLWISVAILSPLITSQIIK
jgi:hypothetical protein